jgi:hypothetical protein
MKLKVQLFYIAFSLFITGVYSAAAITAEKLGTLPSNISEASGLDYNGSSSFWTHNDGSVNKLYKIGSSGSLKQTVSVTGVSSGDWEDVTHDEDYNYMYIGNFGNNGHDRKSLSIYRISYPRSSSTTSLAASTIKFSYPDQKSFPSKWKNFDAEAFYHYDNNLYIFTKGEGSAAAYTKMYKVPDSPGTYVAELVDSFYVDGRITGAAISPNHSSVVLITNTRIHLFTNFSDDEIFEGSYKKISIDGSWKQREGVTFYKNSEIYLVDEGSPGENRLYSVDLSSYIAPLRMANPALAIVNQEAKISTYPNPATSFVNIETNEKYERAEVTIVNSSGQVVRQLRFENPEMKLFIETESLPVGMYYIQLIADNRRAITSLISVIR